MDKVLRAFAFLLVLHAHVFSGLNTTLSLDCTQNKTLEYGIAYQKAGNPCWGWLETHTYDLAKENDGQVLNISSLTVSHHTGLFPECSSTTQVLVGNGSDEWRKIDDISVPRAYVLTTKTYSDVGAYRFVRIYNPTCYVDYSAINVTFNETPNIAINGSEIWYYSIDESGVRVPMTGKTKKGELIEIVVTVKNKGRLNASPFNVRFKADDKPEDLNGFYQEFRVAEGLEANSSINVSFNYRVEGDTRTLSFFADSNREVSESDELDNFAYKKLEIEPSAPDYLSYGAALACIGFLVLLLIAALYVWRSYTYSYSGGGTGSVPCPRCGMPVKQGTQTCPVCGKNLRSSA